MRTGPSRMRTGPSKMRGTFQNANGTFQKANGKQFLSRFSGGWGAKSNFPPQLVTKGGPIYHFRQGCTWSVAFLYRPRIGPNRAWNPKTWQCCSQFKNFIKMKKLRNLKRGDGLIHSFIIQFLLREISFLRQCSNYSLTGISECPPRLLTRIREYWRWRSHEKL